MTSTSLDLNVARKNLADVLGDEMKLYLQMLKAWFKQKVSREDFDHEARNLLSSESVHLHNQFLLAIMTKCQSLQSTVASSEDKSSMHTTTVHMKQMKKIKVKRKVAVGTTGLYQRFLPADPFCQTPQLQSQFPDQDDKVPEYLSRDLLLPDVAIVYGRTVVTAWEFGLENVEDQAVGLLMLAIEIQLKTLMSVVVSRRKAYQIRENRFRHAYGTEIPALHVRNSAFVDDTAGDDLPTVISSEGCQMPSFKPSAETAQRNAAVHLACTDNSGPARSKISLFDLLDGLQVHKSALPSHTVYTLTVERLLNRLSHPSNEELYQEELHQQEVALKRDRPLTQQLVASGIVKT